ncbi:hypothetical protein BH708_05320 [Brachybacterium sp. P6-10-X1]|uniref:hypothetical protein n=1 Tax=Brachybacterium sp. P6-10-X1 TaxID=1903186 RepID=UPI00097198A0|nr:hypothetical protein [Brachybacterium sp. P6-10-X1]APX32238.1 hypothetical protein BH708_05320 [Brachybacterium sp. P6-10-X1]
MMTARRSEDPTPREHGRDGAAAAAYWTPTRRREARPAQIRKEPPSSSSLASADDAQDDHERPVGEQYGFLTSSDAPDAEAVEEGADGPEPDSEGATEK